MTLSTLDCKEPFIGSNGTHLLSQIDELQFQLRALAVHVLDGGASTLPDSRIVLTVYLRQTSQYSVVTD